MNRNSNISVGELRLRAERRLIEKRDKSPSPGSELQRLVHELEVPQIESGNLIIRLRHNHP